MDLKTSLINLQCEMVAERTLVNPRNISWLQYDILFQLTKVDAILPSKLSIILGITRAQLSKSLKALKSAGYIIQTPNPVDGRELWTSITQEGENLMRDISLRHDALYQTALQVFTPEEQAEFASLSVKLSEALKDERLAKHE